MPVPKGFVEDTPQATVPAPPPGFVPDDQPQAPPDSFVGGLGRRARDVVKSFAQPPSGPGEYFAGPALPIYRALKSYPSSAYQGLKQAGGYAKNAYNLPQGADPLTRFLTYMRAGTTGLAAINPLTSSSATNINTLTDQGRRAEAAGQGGFDAALLSLGLKSPEGGTQAGETLSATTDFLGAPSRGAKILMQEAAGAGKEPVVLARRAANTKFAKAQGAYEEQLAQTAKDNAAKRTAAADQTAAREQYVQKEFAARQGERSAQAAQAQKEVIARAQKEYAKIAMDNLRQAQKVIKGKLDARWNQMRGAIGNQPIDTFPLADAIATAEAKYLAGSPESVASFRQLTNFIHEPNEFIQGGAPGATKPALRPISWEEARIHYSNITDRMFNGDVPGNVYQALKYVRQSLDEQLGKTASKNGLGKQYGQLKSDYSQYKDDFDDTSGMLTGGGSPLARIIRMQTPEDAAALIKGKYGARLAEQAARYQKEGANPNAIGKFRELDRRAEGIEKPKVPAHPKRLEPAKEPPQKAAPKPPVREQIDPEALRLQQLTRFAGRPYYFNPIRSLDQLLLKSEALRRAVAKQPRKEIEP